MGGARGQHGEWVAVLGQVLQGGGSVSLRGTSMQLTAVVCPLMEGHGAIQMRG